MPRGAECRRLHHGYVGLALMGTSLLVLVAFPTSPKAAALAAAKGLAGFSLALSDVDDLDRCLS